MNTKKNKTISLKKKQQESNKKKRLLCLIDQDFLMTKIAEMKTVAQKMLEIKAMSGIITLSGK